MKHALILYVLIIGYLFLDTLVIGPLNLPLYNEIINPALWIGLCSVAIYLSRDDGLRVKDGTNKIQSLIVCMIIYIIIYFLLGLIFGFQRTPYSKEFFSLVKNIWAFGGIVFFQEIIRYSLIKMDSKSKLNLVMVSILFIFVTLPLAGFFGHYHSIKDGFTFTASILIPTIVASLVLTYLSYIGGAVLPIIYRLVVLLPEFIVPIIPDLDWFATALVGIVLPLGVFVYLNYVHITKEERLSRRDKKKYSPVIYIPAFTLVALAAGFVIGLFKYQPIAIVSGSMSPTFNRGDAVVINKLNDAERWNLKKGDVVQFVHSDRYVVHRIVKISSDSYGNTTYITRGDANNGNDAGQIYASDIKGKVIFIIPYIGYPSVWLSDVMSQ